jgi:hypothetical protein
VKCTFNDAVVGLSDAANAAQLTATFGHVAQHKDDSDSRCTGRGSNRAPHVPDKRNIQDGPHCFNVCIIPISTSKAYDSVGREASCNINTQLNEPPEVHKVH